MMGQNWMRARRKELGISQEDLAILADISQTMVSQYETGKVIPRVVTAKRIAKALKVDWERFYEEGEE